MQVAITKMSQNGQVVIPSEVRQDAEIRPQTKFIVFNEGGNILLKQIRKKKLREEIELIARLERSEEEIAKGKFSKADTSMSTEKIDEILLD